MLQMIAAFAEFESNQRGELITSVMSHLKKERKVYCGVTPLGFHKVEGKLIPDDSEMKIVKTVYDLREGGLTFKDIARELNKQGVKGKKGGRIESTTITKILNNTIYEGLI